MRESGFYWVKIHEHWSIGEFFDDTEHWLIIGDDCAWSDQHLDAIGDKIEDPETKMTLPNTGYFYERAMKRSAEIKAGINTDT
jgi:hypothetical protein